jgi:H+/Cl- antiporter ClcA
MNFASSTGGAPIETLKKYSENQTRPNEESPPSRAGLIVEVTEELREHFAYGFASLQSVIVACCLAVVVSSWLLGQGPLLPIHHLGQAPLAALPLFLVLGALIGALGVVFNRLLLS